MINRIVDNKKLIIGAVALMALLSTAVIANQSISSPNQASVSAQPIKLAQSNYVQSIGGSPQDYIEKNATKVASIEEARAMLSYDFPVPTDDNGHKLTGVYVEDERILYLKYNDAIYVVYHKLPEGFDPNIEDTLSQRSDLDSVEVRGNKGIAGEVGKGLNSKRAGGELIWYEDGLDIAIYSLQGTRVGQLMKIAKSMKYLP